MLGWFRKKEDPNKAANDKVLKTLADHGDDGRRARRVLHFVCPREGGGTNETLVLDFLVAKGFDVDPAKSSEGLIAECRREVASEAFDGETKMLTAAMDQFGWRYDGWECAVETGR